MHVDVKVTVWKRVKLPDEMTKEEAVEILERTGSVNEFFENESKYPDFEFDYDELENTEEDMIVDENNGQSTLQLEDEDNTVLWENGKEIS